MLAARFQSRSEQLINDIRGAELDRHKFADLRLWLAIAAVPVVGGANITLAEQFDGVGKVLKWYHILYLQVPLV